MSKCASDGVKNKVECMSDIAAHQTQYHTVSTSHCSESLSLSHSLTLSLTHPHTALGRNILINPSCRQDVAVEEVQREDGVGLAILRTSAVPQQLGRGHPHVAVGLGQHQRQRQRQRQRQKKEGEV
jgi:hypothetical protein